MDEIIVVDTGSVDRTKEIVEKYTSNIYDFQWIDDLQQGNFSFQKRRKSILWLDADDVLLEDAQEALKLLKRELILKLMLFRCLIILQWILTETFIL